MPCALARLFAGGFQMVSLLHLADISEEGVTFQSPTDGSRMLLTPEHSIAVQVGCLRQGGLACGLCVGAEGRAGEEAAAAGWPRRSTA